MKELWIAGVHSDVGGGYSEKESGLSKIAFEWMASEAKSAGLIIDENLYSDLLGGSSEFAEPDPHALAHNSLCWGWWFAEFIPRRRWHPAKRKEVWIIPFFGNRFIPENALFHPTVEARRARPENKYSPSNLQIKGTLPK